jgi:2-oxoglutarate ferredoxin oxidoreductase subunit gamma
MPMPEKSAEAGMEKAVRQEIRLAGSGGQGIIMAAIVLAEAAGVHEGKQVSQTQSYGPEARGGTCKAEVVISDAPIDYPKVAKPDFLLAMNQASVNSYFGDLKPTGLLIVDSTLVSKVPTAKTVSIPFTKIAREELGTDLVANMVALGALGWLSKRVSIESLEEALLSRVPPGTEELNLKALRAGVEAAKSYDLNKLPQTLAEEEE